MGAQPPLMIPQTILSDSDISLGLSMILFSQMISGTIVLSIGTNVLQSRLIAQLQAMVPEVDPAVVISAGASNLVQSMGMVYPQYVDEILQAYCKALQAVFLVPVILAVLSILGTVLVEWKSVKKNKADRVTDDSEDLEMDRAGTPGSN